MSRHETNVSFLVSTLTRSARGNDAKPIPSLAFWRFGLVWGHFDSTLYTQLLATTTGDSPETVTRFLTDPTPSSCMMAAWANCFR